MLHSIAVIADEGVSVVPDALRLIVRNSILVYSIWVIDVKGHPLVSIPVVGTLRFSLAPGEVVALLLRTVGTDVHCGPLQAVTHIHEFVTIEGVGVLSTMADQDGTNQGTYVPN